MNFVEHLLTVVAWVATGSVIYYLVFFAAGLVTTRRRSTAAADTPGPRVAIVIPAHNEALVIETTVRRLRDLQSDRWVAYVMNDGSTDATADLARYAAEEDTRIRVIDRDVKIAGQGKGAVLNHAFRLISQQVAEGDPLLGDDPEHVVVCVVDADGWLEPHALREVAPLFDDPKVAGVQLPVRMWNAYESLLTVMQDAEFLSFGRLVQAGRDPLGSVGLGGNGQFVRLSALQGLGRSPWSACLTEDLDLSMALIAKGYKIRFCPHAAVAQQGLPGWRALTRQRTRWIQGHYSCWQHIRPILTGKASLLQKLDACFYLFAVALVPVFFTLLLVPIGTALGLWSIYPNPWAFVSNEWLHYSITMTLTFAPILFVMASYRLAPSSQVPAWAMPGVFMVFCIYGYAWSVPATLRAWGRILARRSSWSKTARVPITGEALAAEARVLEAAHA